MILGWFRDSDTKRLNRSMNTLDGLVRKTAREKYPTNKWKLVKRVFGRFWR